MVGAKHAACTIEMGILAWAIDKTRMIFTSPLLQHNPQQHHKCLSHDVVTLQDRSGGWWQGQSTLHARLRWPASRGR